MDKMINEPLCFMCEHLVYWPYCRAFDGEIPEGIRRGVIDHRKDVPGDHGLVWQPVKKASAIINQTQD